MASNRNTSFMYNPSVVNEVLEEFTKITNELQAEIAKARTDVGRLKTELAAAKASAANISCTCSEEELKENGCTCDVESRKAEAAARIQACEQAIAKAETIINNLEADVEAMHDASELVRNTLETVYHTEQDVEKMMNDLFNNLKELTDLHNTDKNIAVNNSVNKLANKAVTGAEYVYDKNGNRVYAALYEDFRFEDYVKLAGVIGVDATLRIMGANGKDTAMGMGVMSKALGGKNLWSWDDVKKRFNQQLYIDEVSEADITAVKGKGETKGGKVSENVTISEDGIPIFKVLDVPETEVGRHYDRHTGTLTEEEQRLLYEMCDSAGVDYYLALATVLHESGCDPNAGNKWCKGYMAVTESLMSAYAPGGSEYSKGGTVAAAIDIAKAQGADFSNVHDPKANLAVGVSMYAAWQKYSFGDNMAQVVNHYGEGCTVPGNTKANTNDWALADSTVNLLWYRDQIASQAGAETWDLWK